ncbi:hypothetical protein GCM10027346_38280 [Hymenobacter seoulensis]
MPQFKPAKIESRRGRIPVSDEARREARAGMGGEQTALAAATPPTPVAPAAAAVPAPEAPAPASAAPGRQESALDAILALPKPTPRARAVKAAPAPAAAMPEQEHSVKLARTIVQQIKLNLALLPYSPENPTNIKQYLEMAHRLLDAQLRKAGKLPPAT